MTPEVSVIVAGYNQAPGIGLVLAALGASTPEGLEVVIADDGSDPRLVDRLADEIESAPFPVRWCWQEDRGFRKSRSLDRAVMMTRSPLLVFLDGGRIPQ